MSLLPNYKTYIVAAACFGIAALEIFGLSLPGITNDPGTWIMSGLGLIGLRAGIAKIQNK